VPANRRLLTREQQDKLNQKLRGHDACNGDAENSLELPAFI
jgi:hypothetical protein